MVVSEGLIIVVGMMKIGKKKLTCISIVIMIIIFLANLLASTEYNVSAIFISGGGNLMDHLGVKKVEVFENYQFYRLITYGFTQSSVIHLVANIAALWFVGGFFENNVGRIKLVIIFIIGLIIPGCLLALIYPDGLHYGASPAIFACIGVLVNWALREKDLWKTYREQTGAGYVVSYFFLGNVLGVTTLVFHLLGFFTGILLGFIIRFKRTN